MPENKLEIVLPVSLGRTENAPLRKVCVKVYLSELEFLNWIGMAEEAGIRPRGLKPFVLKAHGFANERLANTKGLVKFIKDRIVPFWVEGEARRKAEILECRRIAEKYGLKVSE